MRAHDATLLAAVAVLCAVGLWCDTGCAGDEDGASLTPEATAALRLQPLASVEVPAQRGDIVDKTAAVVLGKALFWEQQVGSDGVTACASCHFAGGADSRRFNVVNPGPNGRFEACGTTAPSRFTTACDAVSDDALGSQGVALAAFTSVSSDTDSGVDSCTPTQPSPFGAARQVTARNAPSVLGAVFYRDLFWDGRASHEGGLAAQATAHASTAAIMSCAGRPFNGPNSLAAKLLARTPLGLQRVSGEDSVLGRLSAAPNRGLLTTYRALLRAAFGPAATGDAALTRFSSYFGQAIEAYEATLIPDDTPFDRYLAGNTSSLSENQRTGLARFVGKAGCASCHAGPELSDATVGFAASHGGDQGFHNIGLRPTGEDMGRTRGAFKTPQLRNVKLTAPYFHNGGKATLKAVVELYNAGGEHANAEKSPRIRRLGLDAREVDALVDFLTNALTDCRTEKERAPFDHPSLAMPDGPTLPAAGANGTGTCPPSK